MTQEVTRNYLEINSLEDLNEGSRPNSDYSLNLLDPINFQLNKFFYKIQKSTCGGAGTSQGPPP